MTRATLLLALAIGQFLLGASLACAQQRKVVLLCDGGRSIVVTFDGRSAQLVGPAGAVHLDQQPAASGIHYAGGGHDLRGKGPEMVWTDPSGVTLKCRDQEWAMRQPQIQEPHVGLAGTSWRLVHFQSSDDRAGMVVPPRVERYTLAFGGDGSLALGLDCNRGTARWQAAPSSAQGGSLTVTPGAMTRAFCGDGAMDTRLLQDMGRVRSYTLADGRLTLALEAGGGTYVWQAVSDRGG